jgi:F5/8 type C domain
VKRLLLAAALAFAACRQEPVVPDAPPKAQDIRQLVKHIAASDAPERESLTNIARGATILSRTGESLLLASAAQLIDGDPASYWMSPPRDLPQSIVIGLPARSRIDRVGLRTPKEAYTANRVQFDASLDGRTWTRLAEVTAAQTADAQWFDVAPAEAMQLRVTLLDFRPSQTLVRLDSVLARGTELEPPRIGAIEGCWSFNGRPATFVQRGARVTGVVAIGEQPLFLDGGSDGRNIRFVWTRGNDYGLAIATVSPDGKHLTAKVWHEEAIPMFDAEPWFGERAPCGALQPREDVALALLRRVGRYSFFAADKASVDHLARLLGALRVPARVVVHEFREATPQANLARSQQRLAELRAALGARAGNATFVAAGSEAPREPTVTQAMREIYSSVDLEIRR